MTSRRRQQNLPGIEPGQAPLEIEIPTMGWEQIGGDMDPGAHGGLIASGDGHAIELIQIQPVREYVGDKEAADVGFPFWTKQAYFDASDLDMKNDDVQSALQTVGLEYDTLEEMEPTQRALAIAEALVQYGRGDEGPAGWSDDIGIPAKVKWSYRGEIAGPEYLSDEDDAFRNEVLGYDDIRSALEEKAAEMADQNEAMAWSTPGDQMLIDIEAEGFDPNTAVSIAEFGDAVAVNGDLETEKTVAGVESELERDGYELTEYGGRIPSSESYVDAEQLVSAVAHDTGHNVEDVEKAAESLDWWQPEIPWGTSGYGSVWAKRKASAEERRTRRR